MSNVFKWLREFAAAILIFFANWHCCCSISAKFLCVKNGNVCEKRQNGTKSTFKLKDSREKSNCQNAMLCWHIFTSSQLIQLDVQLLLKFLLLLQQIGNATVSNYTYILYVSEDFQDVMTQGFLSHSHREARFSQSFCSYSNHKILAKHWTETTTLG